MTDFLPDPPLPAVRASLWLGAITLILLLLGLGLWAAQARITGAVVATGRIDVDGGSYSLQHPDGGVIAEITIREGQEVRQGALLVRLDPQRLLAERASYLQQWSGLEAKRLRLTAELSDAPLPQSIPQDHPDRQALAELLPKEAQLLQSRRDTLRHMRAQLSQRAQTARLALKGVARERAATTTQLRLLREEAQTQQSLRDQGLAQSTKLYSLQREIARLEGIEGEITAEGARLSGEIAQAHLEAQRLQVSHRQELETDLRQTEADTGHLQAVLDAIDLRLRQTELRAPIDGRIFGLQAATAGGVLAPAAVLARIIPSDTALRIWLQIAAHNIHEVAAGQKVRLLLSGMTSDSPMLQGRVVQISPDVFGDPDSGQSFYRAEVQLDAEALAVGLQAGLPVQGFIETASHSPLAYVWSPAQRYFRQALREN